MSVALPACAVSVALDDEMCGPCPNGQDAWLTCDYRLMLLGGRRLWALIAEIDKSDLRETNV